MRYISTRGRIDPIQFQDAVMMGLADDGGLIIPESIPNVADRLSAWRGLEYGELALEVLRLFATDIPEGDLGSLIGKTYGPAYGGEVAPTVRVGPIFVLELWHGPTLAFKDVALQLLGNLFEHILARRPGARLNILGATSGDTGGAAIYGVRGRGGISIFRCTRTGGSRRSRSGR
jgi:threonine synthase